MNLLNLFLELSENGIIITLEEYMEADVEFVASKPAVKIVEEVIPAEMNITMKQVETSQIQLQTRRNFSNGNDN
jgi:cell division protein FtsZ